MLRHQDTSPYIEFTKTVHADFYNDSLTLESKLDAHYGRYMESQSKVFLRDSVIVFNTKGDTFIAMNYIGTGRKQARNFILISQYGFEQRHIFLMAMGLMHRRILKRGTL